MVVWIAQRSEQFTWPLKANYIRRITVRTLDLIIDETVQVIERFIVVQDLICIPLPNLGILPLPQEKQLNNYNILKFAFSITFEWAKLRMLATGKRFALYCCADL